MKNFKFLASIFIFVFTTLVIPQFLSAGEQTCTCKISFFSGYQLDKETVQRYTLGGIKKQLSGNNPIQACANEAKIELNKFLIPACQQNSNNEVCVEARRQTSAIFGCGSFFGTEFDACNIDTLKIDSTRNNKITVDKQKSCFEKNKQVGWKMLEALTKGSIHNARSYSF